MSTVLEAKQQLRALLKQKRKTLTAEQKKEWDSAIVAQIAASEQFRRASAILLYAPLEGEINLLPLARLARKQGKAVAFPRCDTETNTMQFYRLEPDARLIQGAYGIAEPPEGAPLCETDADTLCVLPALTFDPTGARLGYGKGYYDRFLETFSGVTVGAVYRSFMVKHVPTETHDRPVVYLFTECGMLKCKPQEAPTEPSEPQENAHTSADLSKPSMLEAVKKRILKTVRTWTSALRKRPQTAVVAADTDDVDAKAAGEGGALRAPHAPPILVAATFVLLLLSRLIDTRLTDRNNEYVVVILLQLLIFLIPAVIYGMLRSDRFPARIRMQAPRMKHLWFTVCVLVVMVSGGLLCGILTGGISSLAGNFTLYDTFVARINGSAVETIYVILAYGVLPAFCEELIYRSILCAEYERFGVGVSVAVSALFFAMLHFSFPLFLSYLFLGAILAGAMYTTRSFFTAFVLHLCYNLFCLFGQPYLSAFYVNAGSNEIFIFCLVVLFLLFGAFAAGEARKIYHIYARENLDSSYTVSVPVRRLPKNLVRAVLSPACAVCTVIWLVMAIVNILS